jgi:hypothetical protein
LQAHTANPHPGNIWFIHNELEPLMQAASINTADPVSAPPTRLTGHASTRIQQRGIPRWFLDLLLDHGKTHHDGHGAVIKSVTRDTRQRFKSALSPQDYVRAERYFGVYAVVASDDAVITAARRNRRKHFQ